MAEEHDLQTLCLQYAELRGVFARRNNVGVGKDHVRYGLGVGSTDIVLVIPPTGRAAFVEIKRPGEKPRPEQSRFLAEVQMKGALAVWIDTFGKFQTWLDTTISQETRTGRRRA